MSIFSTDRVSFDAVKPQLPEEKKALLELTLADLRLRLSQATTQAEEQPIKDSIQQIETKISGLGGHTRQQLVTVLENYDLENYWYGGVFSHYEAALSANLIREFAQNSRASVLDLAVGTGRSIEHLFMNHPDILEILKPSDVFATDLLRKYVDISIAKLGKLGVNPAHITVGDYVNLPGELRKGKFNVVWAMMNSLFYCTTEDDLVSTLRGISEALIPGGVFLLTPSV
ncbi:class I SAM-dependent methyltransferase [Candidatus Peregrinibacteria bacterium]|nr:MAG: class I SAM-dependent methyltransferase [Candidatus Peregrinibacteria bacterium]